MDGTRHAGSNEEQIQPGTGVGRRCRIGRTVLEISAVTAEISR
jgi:hypothetical protein